MVDILDAPIVDMEVAEALLAETAPVIEPPQEANAEPDAMQAALTPNLTSEQIRQEFLDHLARELASVTTDFHTVDITGPAYLAAMQDVARVETLVAGWLIESWTIDTELGGVMRGRVALRRAVPTVQPWPITTINLTVTASTTNTTILAYPYNTATIVTGNSYTVPYNWYVQPTMPTGANEGDLWFRTGGTWTPAPEPAVQPQVNELPDAIRQRVQNNRARPIYQYSPRPREYKWDEIPGVLTPSEKRQVRRHNFLRINSAKYPNRRYEIPADAYNMVKIVEAHTVDGKRELVDMASLCLQPTRPDMTALQWLALQKLLLEADEERYLTSANHFPTYRGRQLGYEQNYIRQRRHEGERYDVTAATDRGLQADEIRIDEAAIVATDD